MLHFSPTFLIFQIGTLLDDFSTEILYEFVFFLWIVSLADCNLPARFTTVTILTLQFLLSPVGDTYLKHLQTKTCGVSH
jgi:hypothetical protein